MKYNVGDRVRIKSIDWYNENKDEDGDVPCGDYDFVSYMSVFCGKILTIDVDFEDETYLMKEDNDGFVFTNEMIEGLVEEEVKPEFKVNDFEDAYEEVTNRAFKGGYEKCKSDIELNGFQLPEGYIFKDENSNIINAIKIVLEKKKKEYPKSYKECCDTLYRNSKHDECYEACLQGHPMQTFAKLLICRDAYWKIAEEEMGLGKPWKPDWTDLDQLKYCIWVDVGEFITMTNVRGQHILAFPTEEMRDDFYENFKELIESVKELL